MKGYSLFTLFIVVFLSACGTVEVSIVKDVATAPVPAQKANPIAIPPTLPPSTGRAVIAYTRDGDAFMWDEATGQSKTIFASGDVDRVDMSDDGQVVALVRHSEVGVALWAVDWNGRNPRELVSAGTLHQRLKTSQTESEPARAGIGEFGWIPGTHLLLYNWTVQSGSGDYRASPDIYLLDTDTLSETALARDIDIEPVQQINIVPSPDGQQLALVTSTALSFLNVDGSNPRNNVLTYPAAGMSSPPMLMPAGVWTQDSRFFLIAASVEMDTELNFGFSIWRVPVDRSAPEALTPILPGRPDSVTYSPDGKYVAFIRNIQGALISPFARDVGPLAPIFKFEPATYANLHWSPAGDAFTKDLMQLCSDASRETHLCETPFNTHMSGVAGVQWLDGQRVLFLTNAPSVLFLSRLNGPPMLINFSGSFDGVLVEQEQSF